MTTPARGRWRPLGTADLRDAVWAALRDELLRQLRAIGADYAPGAWGEDDPRGVPAGRREKPVDPTSAASQKG